MYATKACTSTAALLLAVSLKLYLNRSVLERLHGLRLVAALEMVLRGCKWRLEGSRFGLFVSKSSVMVCQRRTILQQRNRFLVGFWPAGGKKMGILELWARPMRLVASSR
jgi:hypothetical protein